jgi:fimbrial isopeptide formation D2 family protein/uncharacterized repeat protein (TIGR01451 family)
MIRTQRQTANRKSFAARNRRLFVEQLESRRVMAGLPTASIFAEPTAMIGQSIPVQVSFDNTHASDPGYGPFVDLYVPRNGADGVNGVGTDGLSFVAGSATYLGAPLSTTVLIFPNSGGGTGSVLHPYAKDALGAPIAVTGPAGDQLVVLQLPFGSFTSSQPAATIDLSVQMSNLADLGTPLSLRARAGFQYGTDPLDNPNVDPVLFSSVANANAWPVNQAITPTLLTLTKTYIGPEDETATGPNFPRQYQIDIDVANGQTITAADIVDLLPNNVQLVSVDSFVPATGAVTTTPTTPANAPGNELVVRFPTLTGTSAANDATVVFTYFVPFRNANSTQIIDPVSGNDATAPNNARFEGDWNPIDTRDAGGTNNAVANPAGPEHELTPKSIAVQKTVAIVSDVGGAGYSGGDTVEYTIDFQISDYFAFQDLAINDILSDGQRFDTSFTPTLLVTEHGSISTGNINAANFVITDRFTGGVTPVAPINGTQIVDFAISDELVTRSLDGTILGGLIPVGGTGAGDPNPTNFNGGASTGRIVFRAIIQDDFTDDFPSADASVDEGDTLDNDVSITGTVRRFNDLSVQQSESDLSGTSFDIVSGTLTKSIYAINGNTTLPTPLTLAPGDTITYRVQLTIPSSDVEDLRLDDYLPLPVLQASQVTTFNDVVSASIPAAGTAKFGPADTFRAIYGAAPALSTDPVSNRVSFDYGDFDRDPSVASTIDLLFTVTASSAPFADGLFLTNQVRRSQDSTNAGSFTNDAIVQIVLGQPNLVLSKGIVSTDNPVDIYNPATVGPVTFSAPGTAGYRGSATIHSTNLDTTPILSNVRNVDAGDIVTFAIVVENTGTSRRGAFDVQLRDTLPAGFAIPTGGLNLNVSDGTGAAMTFTAAGTGLFDAAGGIRINDPGATAAAGDGTDAGALDAYDATDGRNILIVTYDLVLQSTAQAAQVITNTATLTNYASVEGGPDFTSIDLTDSATTTLTAPVVTKVITSTNQASTTSNNVAIGEIVTYQSVITIPEGTTNNFVWTDTPSAGLAIVDIVSVTSNSGNVTASAGTFAAIRSAATIPALGASASLNFGNLSNANTDDTASEQVTITYRAVVLNTAGNNRTTVLDNQIAATHANGTISVDGPEVIVVEPQVSITQTISPGTGQSNQIFTVTVDVAHTPTSDHDAFDLSISDVIPAGLIYVGGSLANVSGLVPTTLGESSGTVSATFTTFPDGSTSRIQFQVQASPSVVAGSTITSTVNQSWSSLPGAVTTAQSSNALSTERTGSISDPGGAANDHRASDSDSITIISPVLTKTLVSTNQAHTTGTNVAIGEIVTYDLVLTVPQGVLPSSIITDTPDAGLAIINVVSITGSASITSSLGALGSITPTIPVGGSSLTVNLGTLTNSDTSTASNETVTIRYRAVILNTLANDAADVLDNQGGFTWGTTGTLSVDGPDLTLVEPQLSIVVSDGSPATADAGDTITFTINVGHTGASTADGFDLNLQNLIDSLPNHLQYVPGSLNVTNAGGAVSGTNTTTGGDLNLAWSTFPLAATATVTFQALVENTAPAASNLTNTASLRWTSLPTNVTTPLSSNALSVERTGNTVNPGAAANDHAASDSGIVTTRPPVTSKTVLSTNVPGTGVSQLDPVRTDVTIGELVTYNVTVTLPEGTNTLTITDQLPSGPTFLEMVSATVVSVGSRITAAAPTITITDTNADSINDRSRWVFGSVLNTPDSLANAGDVVTVQVVARVLDRPGNTGGVVLSNIATIDVSGSTSVVNADVEIVRPQLQISVVANTLSGPPGSIVPYTITINHAAGSTGPAYDLDLTELLSDPNLDLVPGSIVTSRGTIASGNGPTDTTLRITDAALLLGETITVTFNGRVNPSVAGGLVLPNTSAIAFDSLPGAGGRNDSVSDPASFTTTAPQVDLQITSTISQSPTVINTPLTYTLTVRNNGPSTATAVQVLDTLPGSVTAVSAIPSQGTAGIVASVMTANLGTLLPGQTATIVVNVVTPAFATTIDNLATVSALQAETLVTNNETRLSTAVRAVSSLSGRSWVDVDRDGVVDTGERTLPGVGIVLTGTNDLGQAVSRTTTTDSSGNYLFDLLRPGTYQVRQQQPTLFSDGSEYIGSQGGTRPANDVFQVALTPGVNATDYLFAELGLRSDFLSKRSLVHSRIRQASNPTQDIFRDVLSARGQADLDGDGDVDADDFALFGTRLGGQFNV